MVREYWGDFDPEIEPSYLQSEICYYEDPPESVEMEEKPLEFELTLSFKNVTERDDYLRKNFPEILDIEATEVIESEPVKPPNSEEITGELEKPSI